MKRKSRKRTRSFVSEEESLLRVIYWFFAHPEDPVGLSDLAEAVRIAKTTANRVVTRLAADGFLNIDVLGRVWRITCSLDHEYNTTLKIPFNLSELYASGLLPDIQQQYPQARAIVFFGSYRKGQDTTDSDIDIAVESEGSSRRPIPFGHIKVGHRSSVPVTLHVFSRKHVDVNLFADIANGIVLDGFLEVRP
ncbi:MAG: nucleotidyltransferase domain-containing protein [Candidatus Woesearchaeota archaeon]|jgi:predicted nucleotidyltransferase|nr:nucleotidyltransferase domain-containing protein [Candidatus Woesearchaeota archaeon]MDP7198597.1 nucleotidyltransferase domain-containing protein [Candidatus Woesearchaeota archaeon]MDP7466661.1 nucleotidyltransferase domain-containing protein [Candidatus Woesearchaeota archaeon]MDP7646917.1 nucleotidyltransferase domain-containing protein [Candidatus Woesearchaeota archaeon]